MNTHIRVKIICNWSNSKQLHEHLASHFTNDIKLTWTTDNVDYYFILDSPFNGELFDPSKTILLKSAQNDIIWQHEPLSFLKIISMNHDIESVNVLDLITKIICQLTQTPDHQSFEPLDQLIYQKYFGDINKDVKTICFLHCCSVNDASKAILDEIVSKIMHELINDLDYLYIINIGTSLSHPTTEKVKVINYSDNPHLFEKPTLNLMLCFSKYHSDAKILYLHTKGISYPLDCRQISDWRDMLLFFLVERYRICLKLLDEYDAVGSNYSETPHPHFSGNFWWSRSKHISTLSPIVSNVRHDCEWWLFSDNTNVKKHVLYTSNVNHYMSTYPRSIYDPK